MGTATGWNHPAQISWSLVTHWPTLLHLSLVKFQQEWSQGVQSGAVWRIRKKQCLRPGVKNCHSDRCVKNVVRQTPVWRQFIISQTMHCHGNSAVWPPCYLPWILPVHSGRHVGQVRRSCTKLVFADNVVSCICRGMHWQSNQFQMT